MSLGGGFRHAGLWGGGWASRLLPRSPRGRCRGKQSPWAGCQSLASLKLGTAAGRGFRGLPSPTWPGALSEMGGAGRRASRRHHAQSEHVCTRNTDAGPGVGVLHTTSRCSSVHATPSFTLTQPWVPRVPHTSQAERAVYVEETSTSPSSEWLISSR